MSGCKKLGLDPSLLAYRPYSWTVDLRENLDLTVAGAAQLLGMSDSPEAVAWMKVWNTPELDQMDHNMLPLEAYCLAAKVSPSTISDIVLAMKVRRAQARSVAKTAARHPDVVEKTIDFAMLPGGEKDREMVHKAAGWLPTPKGAVTNVNVHQKTTVDARQQSATIVPAPAPEATIRRLADRFNGVKQDRFGDVLPAQLPALVEDITIPPRQSREYAPVSAAPRDSAPTDDDYLTANDDV